MYKNNWHRWFAWFPVRIDGKRVWLEHIERRGSMKLLADTEGYPYESWTFQYRRGAHV